LRFLSRRDGNDNGAAIQMELTEVFALDTKNSAQKSRKVTGRL